MESGCGTASQPQLPVHLPISGRTVRSGERIAEERIRDDDPNAPNHWPEQLQWRRCLWMAAGVCEDMYESSHNSISILIRRFVEPVDITSRVGRKNIKLCSLYGLQLITVE